MSQQSYQQYSISSINHGALLASDIQKLRFQQNLVDCTLVAGGRRFPAHKILLSAASPFIKDLLMSSPSDNPTIILANANANDLEALLHFIYHGEVNVSDTQLHSILQLAKSLNIQILVQKPVPNKIDKHQMMGNIAAAQQQAAQAEAPKVVGVKSITSAPIANLQMQLQKHIELGKGKNANNASCAKSAASGTGNAHNAGNRPASYHGAVFKNDDDKLKKVATPGNVKKSKFVGTIGTNQLAGNGTTNINGSSAMQQRGTLWYAPLAEQQKKHSDAQN